MPGTEHPPPKREAKIIEESVPLNEKIPALVLFKVSYYLLQLRLSVSDIKKKLKKGGRKRKRELV